MPLIKAIVDRTLSNLCRVSFWRSIDCVVTVDHALKHEGTFCLGGVGAEGAEKNLDVLISIWENFLNFCEVFFGNIDENRRRIHRERPNSRLFILSAINLFHGRDV